MAEEHDEPLGAGTLVLVVGASGAGKDTLIEAARRRFRDDPRLVFPQRVITRGGQTGEAHVGVDEAEFARLEADGALFLAWRAHGNAYGIPITARRALEAGHTVVVNVSRTVIARARALWPRTRVIHVTIDPRILKDRLLARRREAGDAVAKRLARAGAIPVPDAPWVDEVDNSGDPAAAAARFTALIARHGDAAPRDRTD